MSEKFDRICAVLKSLSNLQIFKSFSCVSPDILVNFRSSFLKVFCKTGVLKIFAKFTRKHLCQSRSFDEVAVLRLSGLRLLTSKMLV